MAVGNSMGIGIPMVNLGLGGGGGGGSSFLLDDYPNATGHSYSLRQLSSTVTNVVRVRRSTDNTEQDFTATEITDGTLATFCTAFGQGFVTKWYDQSNSSDVLNFTALQQPRIYDGEDGGLRLENGKPCVEFDGVDDSLQVLLGLPFSSIYYLFAVNTWVSAPAEGDGYMYGLRTPSGEFLTGDDLSNSISWDGSTGRMKGNGIQNAGGVTDLTFPKIGTFPQSLYYAKQAVGAVGSLGSTLKINTNQYPAIGATANGSRQINSIHLGESGGGSFSSNIKLQEFILYFADPGLNATAIESNINTHYSIY